MQKSSIKKKTKIVRHADAYHTLGIPLTLDWTCSEATRLSTSPECLSDGLQKVNKTGLPKDHLKVNC